MMKKLFIFVILALAVFPAFADAASIQKKHKAVIARKNVSASSCSYPGDEFQNGLTSAGAIWTTLNGDAVFNAALSGTPPTCSGTNGLSVTASGTEESEYADHGSLDTDTTDVNIHVEMRIASDVDLDDADVVPIMYNSDGTTQWEYDNYFVLKNTSGTYYLVYVTGGGSSEEVAFSSWDTWLEFDIHYDTTAASCYWTMNQGAQHTFTRDDVDPRYLHLGAIDGMDTGDVLNIQIGYASVNTP